MTVLRSAHKPAIRKPAHPTASLGELTSFDVEDSSLDAATLVTWLRKTFRSPAYRPPVLPKAAIELMALAREPEAPLGRVTKLLESEPLLAGEVLRRAQSSVYSRGEPARSLHDAVVRLGTRTLSDFFLEASMNARVFRSRGYEAPMAALQLHSSGTAHIAARVARRTALYEDYAFLGGLLHDAGAAACLIVIGEGSGRVDPPPFELVGQALREVHAEASVLLAERWELAADVRLVLRHHHDIRIGGHIHPFGAIIAIAEWIGARSGLGFADEGQWEPNWAFEALGLASSSVEALLKEGQDVATMLGVVAPTASPR